MKPAEIKEFRKQKKMSQEKLGTICGVSKTAVSKWEKGETEPSGPSLIQLTRLMQGDVVTSELSAFEQKLLSNNIEAGNFKDAEEYLTASLKYLLKHKSFMPIHEEARKKIVNYKDLIDEPTPKVAEEETLYKPFSVRRTYLAAGLPIDSQIDDTYATVEDFGDNYFAGTAQGESMHPTIKHGETSLFLAKKHWNNPNLKKGDIYAFIVEGEKTIKRYNTRPATQQEMENEEEYLYTSSGTGKPSVRVLLSDNPEHSEIIWRNGEVEAIGWFVKLLRK